MKKYVITITSLIIFLLTILFYLFISTDIRLSEITGFVMAIPLLSVLVYQRLVLKMKVRQTLGLTKPTKQSTVQAFIIPISIGIITQFLLFTINGQLFLFEDVYGLLFILLTLIPLILSALIEEIVWRGNFHYHLRHSYSLLKTALITGTIWSIWHLPIALTYKEYSTLWLGTLIYLVTLFVISILLSYIREYGNSVIAAAIMHGTFNGFYFSKGTYITWSQEYVELLSFTILIIFLIVFLISLYTINRKKVFH